MRHKYLNITKTEFSHNDHVLYVAVHNTVDKSVYFKTSCLDIILGSKFNYSAIVILT